jgi:DNA-binding CsgD family transcriptional regulator/PAS domain-containing protein
MLDATLFSEIIGAIYDSILEPKQWQVALQKICHVLDAPAASIHTLNPIAGRTILFADHGSDPVYVALANTKYRAMNPVGISVLLGEIGQPLGLFDLIDEAELVETRWYQEWCVPQRYRDMMGVIIAKRPSEIGAVAAVRLLDQPLFGKEERAFFALIAPHVQRAVTISGLLEQRTAERDSFASVMDQLSTAVFLVEATGRVLHANAAAQATCNDPLVVRTREGILSFCDLKVDRAVHAALLQPSAEPRFIPASAPDGAALAVAVLLIDATTSLQAIFIHVQESDTPAFARYVQQFFQLTPREVCVLLPLLEGKEIVDIADQLGIARATAKSHLDRLFQKTGTNRQADLVQQVLKAIPPVRLG